MDYREKIQELLVKRDSYRTVLLDRMGRRTDIENELKVVLDSQKLVQEVAEAVQSKLSSRIDDIVNLGLTTCFPGYTFEMRYVQSRGKTEVQFIVKDGDKEIDPLDQCGGGLVDVLCFCLRLAVYSISNVGNVLIFDEPYRFISRGLRSRVAELLSVLSKKLDLEIIMVTHIDEFAEASDKKFYIKKINGTSEVVEYELQL